MNHQERYGAQYNDVFTTRDAIRKFSHILSLEPYEMFSNANGLELKHKSGTVGENRQQSERYERKCFNEITTRTPNTIIFGPNLIDYLLEKSPTQNLFRPDAITFSTTEKDWTLKEMYEFKSSKRNHELIKKVHGFSRTLDFMREHPTYLPALVSKSLNKILIPPDSITLPPNKEINVTFVYPGQATMLASIKLPFNVNYKRVRA